jgi:hypothetical protein
MPGLGTRKAAKQAARMPEQGHRLGVDGPLGQLGHDDGQQQRDQRHEDPRRIAAVGRVLAGVLVDEQRPGEGHHTEQRGQEQQQ